MTDKIKLNLDDFIITFRILSNSSDTEKTQTNIQFYINFFNRFPELISANASQELNELFVKLFPPSQFIFQLQDNAQNFVNIINQLKLESIPKQYRKILTEESILYMHSSARIVFDFIFETTNEDVFLIVDNLINTLNNTFSFNDYIIPWYDYTKEKLKSLDFELSKMDDKESEKKYTDYFFSILNKKINLLHRTSEKISIEDDFKLQKILANSYFNSLVEEQNLIPYLLNKIMKENSYSLFEIHSFIPINEDYAVNFIFTAKLVNNELVFGEKNHLFFQLIVKALGAYFSKTNQDSNLFIRAINPIVNIISYDKEMIKQDNHLNEIYGFFFNKDFAYGLNKLETKKILEQDLYTMKYKKPKPGTFYAESAEIFSQYATDKALSIILGKIQLFQK